MNPQEIPTGVYINRDLYLRKGEIEEAIRAYVHTWGRADLMLFIEEVLASYPSGTIGGLLDEMPNL